MEALQGQVEKYMLAAHLLWGVWAVIQAKNSTIEFDFEPGNYMLFCNIAGTVSHAAQGQVLSVTVADVDL